MHGLLADAWAPLMASRAGMQDPLDIMACSSGNVNSPRRLARISGSYTNLASPRVSTQLNWYRGNSIAPGTGRVNLQQVPGRRTPGRMMFRVQGFRGVGRPRQSVAGA